MKPDQLILVLEDDRLEALTLQRAFAEAAVPNRVIIVRSGTDALDMLLHVQTELPGLILLDLNLPGMSGLEFLEQIKLHPGLRRIPVVVLTTSNEAQDRQRAFELSAAGYLVKPMNYLTFVEMIRVMVSYWLLNETAS